MLVDRMDASPRQATEVLDDLDRLRRHTRLVGAPWFPLLYFGALTMLSAPLVGAGGSILALWVVGGAAGMLLTRRHYRRRARHRGATARGRSARTIGVIMFVVCLLAALAAGMIGGAPAALTTVIVVVLASYLALGWLARDPVPSLAIAPGAAIAAAFAVAGLAPWIVELTFGASLVLAGVGLRAAQARS